MRIRGSTSGVESDKRLMSRTGSADNKHENKNDGQQRALVNAPTTADGAVRSRSGSLSSSEMRLMTAESSRLKGGYPFGSPEAS